MADEDPFVKIRRELEEVPTDDVDAKEARLLELGDAVDRRSTELPEVDEYDDRFRDLHAKAFASREMREAQVRQEARERAADQEAYRGLGTGLQLAYAIIGMPVVGFLIGFGLDKATGGNAWSSLLTLAGAVIGIAYAIWMLNKRNG